MNARLGAAFARQRLFTWGFFLTVFLIGLFITGDYGVSCDEPLDQATAAVNLKYVLSKICTPEFVNSFIPDCASVSDLSVWRDRDYGVVFHLPAYFIELALGATDPYDAYRVRHILNFLYCFFGLWCLYAAGKNLFSNGYGILLAVFFILSPRFFAESFYNGKDLVVAAFACMNLWTLSRLLTRDSLANVLLHALSAALLIDNRVIGLAFFATTLGIMAVKALLKRDYVRQGVHALVFAVAGALLVVAFFPYLWEDTLAHFAEVFGNMSVFRHDAEVLYQGEFYNDHHLPWNYIPVWVAVTTPLFILALFALGLAFFARDAGLKLWRRRFKELAVPLPLMLLFCFVVIFGSMLSVIALHSSLYNGWRQMYFIYPPMLFFAAHALWSLRQSRLSLLRTLCWAVTGAGSLWMFAVLILTHPVQNVYFNALALKPWTQYYDVDYWGSATHLAYEWMLKDQPLGEVNFCHESYIFKANRTGMRPEDRARMNKVTCDLADYRISNFFGRDQQDYLRLQQIKDTPAFKVSVLGQDILVVYKGPARTSGR
ncbi:MAG: hypothetical protein SPL30_07965 [Succinivibrio sp.]|nr:hypothetical protein [Succinivibrio sp.]